MKIIFQNPLGRTPKATYVLVSNAMELNPLRNTQHTAVFHYDLCATFAVSKQF